MGYLLSAVLAASLTLFMGVESKHVGCYYGVWAYTRPGLGNKIKYLPNSETILTHFIEFIDAKSSANLNIMTC